MPTFCDDKEQIKNKNHITAYLFKSIVDRIFHFRRNESQTGGFTMSRNILDELYDYDLFHLTEIEDMDGSYKAALDRLVKAEAELKKAFPDSADILDEYQSADIELHNLSNRNEFRKGFKVGAQLVLEMIKPIK